MGNMMSYLDEFIYNSQLGLYIAKEYKDLHYSDGSEEYLSNIFDKIVDNPVYPLTYYKYIKDWPTRYHLDYRRLNLIEAFNRIICGGKVLELGAGTGILTGLLAYYNESVDAIEGNLNRALLIKKRLKQVPNVRVFVSNIKDLFPSERYDFIVLVGVLEYIPFYEKEFSYDYTVETVVGFLKKIKEHLKDDGILLLAIENKFGAKYFSGCREDHNGMFFSGIVGYPFKSPITFSRPELEYLLKEAGFRNIQFYHVFPDYKLPTLFIREDEKIYEMSVSGLWRGFFEDYTGDRRFLFSEPLFIENLIRSRSLFYFSNSFVVLASKSLDVCLKTNWLIRKYYNYFPNNSKVHHVINFVCDEQSCSVFREPLSIANAVWELDGVDYSYRIIPKDDYVKGESLYIKALRYLISRDIDGFISFLQKFKKNIYDLYRVTGQDGFGYDLLKYPVDYVFWNIIEDKNGHWIFVDKKWVTKKDLPIDFIIFRNSFYLFTENYVLVDFKISLKDLIIKVMKCLFKNYDYDRLLYNIKLESEFQSFARGDNAESFYQRLVELLFRVYLSKSWRITRPLRWLRRKLRI